MVEFLHSAFVFGEVTEWPKVYDWKSYVPQKGTAGSTPALSATRQQASKADDFELITWLVIK